MEAMLREVVRRGASDLHLSCGRRPMLRLGGRIERIGGEPLDPASFEQLVRPLDEEAWIRCGTEGDADFAYELEGVARFRVNLFAHHRGRSAVLRVIPASAMDLDELGLPSGVRGLASLDEGLVLVTGPTGSGKSTTLAALVHEMNRHRALHFVTIEDPIEFVHTSQRSLITQREVGPHTRSFAEALRAALREDPDVVLVGELRDLETIELALEAAETGVLVLGTLHTNSAAKTVDRIVNVFPSERQEGIRSILGSVLKAVVAQQLVPRVGGGRAAAVELLLGTPALAAVIREGKTHQVRGFLTSGKGQGMVAMDDSLKTLVQNRVIAGQDALARADDKDGFRRWLATIGQPVDEGVGLTVV